MGSFNVCFMGDRDVEAYPSSGRYLKLSAPDGGIDSSSSQNMGSWIVRISWTTALARKGHVSPTSQGRTDQAVIRNFCIIAHIDHGKSTLADRMLQYTGVVEGRQMRAQYLDRMDIERERGITIKSQAVRLPWTGVDGRQYVLNLIDTPGHVDFSYEVSRSLAACEGAILLVDAAQGIEAQTLANLYLALDADLKIIPVLNKIDLPAAQPERYAAELAGIIGCDPAEVLKVSAKTGDGVRDLLHQIVRQVPPPSGNPNAPARALIFDSVYDTYRGVVTYIRVMDGLLTRRERTLMMSTGAVHETLEVGVISPDPTPTDALAAGEVGYLITGVKDVRQARVGDTVTTAGKAATEALAGYSHPKPMVFSGLYPVDGDDYPNLRDALDKLRLNDAALVYEPETSAALGFGFRCGFLGLLHMEIVRERLEREFDLSLISTAPNVVYRVVMDSGRELTVTNPSDYPSSADSVAGPGGVRGKIERVYEPVVRGTVISPSDYIGAIMELCQGRRGVLLGMEYLSADRVEIRYTLPLAEIIFDFFDQLKSRTRGYASLDYEPDGEQEANLVKVDILLQGVPVDAFSQIVHTENAREYGLAMTAKLKELIPRQQFEVPIQAAIGAHIIARENIRALRKDVLAKCYGGDISRKRKLLEKQKEGKKRMKTIGRVDVPQEAFVAALSTTDTKKR
jgi:GTP-binding protein LepA